jgi:glucose-6-phosphate 1-dehydrogenase
VLQATRSLRGADFAHNTMRGQYRGYLQEKGVPNDSQTATFAALKLYVDNWRWQGVPFYLRSGKALSCRTTQIVVQFRQPPHMLFNTGAHFESNRLVIQIQPAEGIQLHFQTKVPDAGMNLRMTELDFDFRREFTSPPPEAYQRLLLDAAQGDPSLFARSDEVELAWGIIDPIIAAWQSPAAPPLEIYEPGLWGPEESTQWMRDQGRDWFDVCPILH